MLRIHVSAGIRVFGGAIFAGAMAVCFCINQPSFAGPGRPIISNGTVKTADGKLLRALSLVYAARESQTVKDWALNINSMSKARDEAHYNSFRLCEVDMRYGAQGVVTGALPFIDSVVSNCGKLGMYLIIDYHSVPIWDNSEWDSRHFWQVIAPRYKDVAWVIYEFFNEPCQGPPGPYNEDIAIYKIARQAAPNTLLLHFSPVGFGIVNWGGYLMNTFAPLAGFKWSDGKDAFAFHSYIGTPALELVDIRAKGVPLICTESGYVEDGWGPSQLGAYSRQMEWYERNCISWVDWVAGQSQSWFSPNPVDHALQYLLPDAISKGYAWWTSPTPTAPGNFSAQAANSYTVNLRWDKPSVVGNGLVRYVVYRDGQEFSTTIETAFVDNGVLEGSTHAYEVRSLCVGGLESPSTPRIQVTTPADNVPPGFSMVNGAGDGAMVQVVFNEAVEQTGAQAQSNYMIDNGVTVTSATLAADQKQVTLRTSSLSKGVTYTLAVNNVRDRAATPNTIAANSRATFQYVQGITRIRYYPRANYMQRLSNAVFEGTNGTPTDGPYKTLCTLPVMPPPSGWSEVTSFSNFDIGYRYVRYRPSSDIQDGNYGNIAEIEFYSGATKLTGTPFGTPGSYGNSGNDFSKVFDGNTATFMDYAQPYGAYAGLEITGWTPTPILPRTNRSEAHDRKIIIAARGRTIGLEISAALQAKAMTILMYDLCGKLVRSISRPASDDGRLIIDRNSDSNFLEPGKYVLIIKNLETAGNASVIRSILIQ